MTRIGLISDTHGYLDEAVFTHFSQCDEIWHGGDWGNRQLAEALSKAGKPLRGVYGNIDGNDIRNSSNSTIAKMSDVTNSIKGAKPEAIYVALWWFLVKGNK